MIVFSCRLANPFVPYGLSTVMFSDVFRGQRKGALGTNGLSPLG